MAIPKLIIGNKNYSSWSLRSWLILKKLGIEFEEIRIPLFTEGYKERLLQYSPTGQVPVYIEDDLVIWETIAIAEYLAEQHPFLLPKDKQKRAIARSLAAEMHANFMPLRSQMPMNCRAIGRQVKLTPGLATDIERIKTIWTNCRQQNESEGSWLFGDFTMVDAMFAPVVFRFNTYGVSGNRLINEYMNTVLNEPNIKQWHEAAKNETETIEKQELGIK